MTDPSEHIKMQWKAIGNIDQALRTMQRFGIGTLDPAYQQLWKTRGALFGKIGFRIPKAVTILSRLVALSPGTLTLWFDADNGWMTESRARPGAPPVYKRASDEIAITILKGQATHELQELLLIPDTNIDN